MNSEALLEALTPLLSRELEEGKLLLETLKQGQEAFAGRDATAIQRSAEEIQRLFQSLESLESERQQRLQSAGFSSDLEGMDALLADAADAPAAQLWRTLLDSAAEIQKQNEINARIIEGSRQHAEAAFNLLRGREPGSELYSAKGRTGYGGGNASRTLAKA